MQDDNSALQSKFATSLPYKGSVIAKQILFFPLATSGIIFYFNSSDPNLTTGGIAKLKIKPRASYTPGYPLKILKIPKAAISSRTINS